MTQLALEQAPPPSPHRVRALAGVLAGFQWPGRDSFQKLTKGQQRAALRISEETLVALAAAGEEGDRS